MSETSYYVAVVGSGPAGMFAARELARNGAKVVNFNRDIKPGGLAEYGIYPDKHAMKEGLRTQFRSVLDTPGLAYYGNVTIGTRGDLTLDDLRACGFQAILVCVGAQGTKWLGLPGEDLVGVYHAKDLVYHYNLLPPYTNMPFRFGKRVAVVGAGNVMLDISRFFIQKIKVDEVIAVVRRGPAEVKFEKKEMEFVIANLSQRALDDEIARVTPIMQSIGQDPVQARANILEALPKAQPTNSASRFRFDFLASPIRIIGDDAKYVTGLEVEDTTLVRANGDTKARGTGNKRVIPVETVIFAIGDKVDDSFGLPGSGYEFAKNARPRFPIDGISYEAFDPQTDSVIPDVFVAGWSRQASYGLVGVARKDGTNGAKAVIQYLHTLQPVEVDNQPLENKLKSLGKPVITTTNIQTLHQIEEEEARQRGLEEFKFGTNEEMLAKIMSVG